MRKFFFLLFFLVILLKGFAQTVRDSSQPNKLVTSYEKVMVTTPPSVFTLDSFYKKYVDAYGIPIVSSEKVPDDALLIA
ncbi:MAG TPA: hypothetical protein VNT20_16380, partial [Flavisolibacter sp.]|nr:hypothetical protein [Flavisolibacter sp.]